MRRRRVIGDGVWTRRGALRLALFLGSLLLAVGLALAHLGGVTATADALGTAPWWLAVTGVALEGGSFLSYGELEIVALRALGETPRRRLVQRTTIVGASLSKSLPGGAVTATAFMVAALRGNGVRAAPAGIALAASGAMSWAILGLLFPVSAALAIVAGRSGTIALGAAGLAAAAVGLGAVVPVAVRRPALAGRLVARLTRTIARGPLRRWLDPPTLGFAVTTALTSIRQLTTDRRRLAEAAGWAALNWTLDAAVLLVFAGTVGHRTPLLAVPLAYVIGQLVAAVPITPGGVGIVEPAMTAALVAAGAPPPSAIATVLGWRLVSQWLPIVVGLALAPTLLRRRGGSRPHAVARPAATAPSEAGPPAGGHPTSRRAPNPAGSSA